MRNMIAAGAVALAMAAAPAFAAPHARKAARGHAKAMSDSAWVTNIAKDGMAEIELGKLAASKASSDDVKKFGQRMADDHSKANDELKSIAQDKNITLPSDLDPKATALRDRLSKLSGEAFDRAYMRDMVADHQKAVSAFRMESKSGKDADVKAWAAKTLPTIEDHLKMARDTNRVSGTSGKKY